MVLVELVYLSLSKSLFFLDDDNDDVVLLWIKLFRVAMTAQKRGFGLCISRVLIKDDLWISFHILFLGLLDTFCVRVLRI